MRRWWRSHNVRVRLTLWYVAAMVVVLAVYAGVVFTFVSRSASADAQRAVARRLPVGLGHGGTDAGRRHHLVRGHHRGRELLAAGVEHGWRASCTRTPQARRSPLPARREIWPAQADDSIVDDRASDVAPVRVLTRRGQIGDDAGHHPGRAIRSRTMREELRAARAHPRPRPAAGGGRRRARRLLAGTAGRCCRSSA